MDTVFTSDEINSYLSQCFEQMPVVEDIAAGNVSISELKKYALLHYAEIKTFINIKIPARMYLCPHGARYAKHYFCYLYEEEQGHFRESENHADLFEPVCLELGLTKEEMDTSYNRYHKVWLHLFNKDNNYENMVHELAISVAWESFTPHFGSQMIEGLEEHYGLSKDAIRYFNVHKGVDEAHSARAADTLSRYCTSENLKSIAKRAIRKTLIDRLHLKDPYGTVL